MRAVWWMLDRAAVFEFWRHNNRWSYLMCRNCQRRDGEQA